MGTPTNLRTAGQPCVSDAPGPYLSPAGLGIAQAVSLQGTFSRTPGGTRLQADFQVWDVADPEHPQQWLRDVGEQGTEAYVQLEDDSKQLDGVTYAWRVRVLDGSAATPWSSTCHFTIDRSGGPAPTITSTDYPAMGWGGTGAIGVPGAFRLTPASDDTVKYLYTFYASELPDERAELTVDAEGLGGPATLHWTPRVANHHSLSVYAIDRAGNRSELVSHQYYVKETRPSVWSTAYPQSTPNPNYNVGVPGAFELTSMVGETTSFGWRIDEDGPSGTVPATANGTATAMIAPARGGWQTLYVHSVTRDGRAHAPRAYTFLVDNAPIVTRDTNGTVTIGSSLTLHLAPRAPNVEAYLYWPEYSGLDDRPVEKVTVPARADGTADLVWTATEADLDGLRIQSRSADGALSHSSWQAISVDDGMPTVTRTGGTDFGTRATFTARTTMSNVAEYVATMNSDEATKQVLTPAADGSVTFSFTSTKLGHNYVQVVARNAAGVQTEEGSDAWTVTDGPRVSSTDFPTTRNGRVAPGTFSFTPRMPGTTAYEYAFNFGSYTRMAAGPDGDATLTWTPPGGGTYVLTVRSVTAGGTRSMTTQYGFVVEADVVRVTSVSPAIVAPGAVRTITIKGTRLDTRDTVQVAPATGQPLATTVKAVSADGTTMTAEIDLTTAPAGPATLTLHPHDGSRPVVVDEAFTISPPLTLRVTKPPTISGRLVVGGTVTANPGGWTPTPTSYQYQWWADGVLITGATGATLRITPTLSGKRLSVAVTAIRSGYTSVRVTSATTAAIAHSGRIPPPPTKGRRLTTTPTPRSIPAA
ncbi:hypothetical protein [Micromonospora sp. CPCC 205539]|uniref:hypothetical protein n=1 Tax=Micromonospora sp. CPCC 205539 TaxID=3122408 RepID=UPI002FEF17F1